MCKITCPNCGGKELNKKGHNESGSQRYLCKTCGKKFTPNAKILPPLNKTCPYCQSNNILRHGYVSGVQPRFLCKACGKQFTDTTVIKEIKEENLLDTCPYCNSHDIKKGGFLESGKRRYQCKTCGKGFSEGTIIREKLDKVCPNCNSTRINRHGYEDGSPRYLCRDCGKRFSDSEPRTYTRYDKTCPKCGNKIAIKGGKDHDRQLWICKSCNHKFSEEPKYVHIAQDVLDKIPFLLKQGYYKTEIAKQLNISVKSVQNHSKGLLTNEEARKKLGLPSCKFTAKEAKVSAAKNKTSQEIIDKIKEMASKGCLRKDIASKLNVSTDTVSKYWKDVEKPKKAIIVKKENKVESKKVEIKQPKIIDKQPVKSFKQIEKENLEQQLKKKQEQDKITQRLQQKEIAKKNEQLQQEKLKLDLDWQRQLRQAELEMERQEKQKQIAIQKEKEEFVTSLRKEYENKLQFNFSIPEHFITEFRILTNEYLKGKTSKDHLEQNFTNCLNITLKEMLQTQEDNNKINEEEKRKLACKEVMSGFPEIKIAEKYNIPLEELQELLKPLYKKETITESQKQMIIKYGIMLKVPVEYMAEYIPCSERMCNKIMEQNKNIKYTISENKPTAQVKEKVQIGRPRGAKKVINESKVLAKR